MNMNFGSLANAKPTNTNSFLKPYEIHENVTIKGTEIKEGTSSNGNPWKSLNITFGNDNGIYKHSIFWITSDKDFERGVQEMSNGGKRELPSNWERTSDLMASIGFAFAPEQFAKLQAASSKAKSFDDIALAFKKMCDAVIDNKATNMKLVGRNSNGRVYATLPNCTGIACADTEEKAARNNVRINDWYTWRISPFNDSVSALDFSNYEMQKAEEYKNAKPTKMPETKDIDNVSSDDEEIDFESLL